jgi:phage tail-like protein
MADRHDPLRNFRYRLEIDGITQAGFSEVAIGDSSTDPIDYREGNEPKHVRKLSGLNKFANVTLKWGITESTELAEWRQLVVDDGPLDAARRTVVIRVQNEVGDDKAAFEVVNAWPCKYDPTDLNGKGNDAAVDSLELCHEGIKRIQ